MKIQFRTLKTQGNRLIKFDMKTASICIVIVFLLSIACSQQKGSKNEAGGIKEGSETRIIRKKQPEGKAVHIYKLPEKLKNIEKLVYSPIDPGKIWILCEIYSDTIHSLDPDTGEWEDLSEKLGKFSRIYSPDHIVRDPVCPEQLWFSNENQGVMSYNYKTGDKKIYDKGYYFFGKNTGPLGVAGDEIRVNVENTMFVFNRESLTFQEIDSEKTQNIKIKPLKLIPAVDSFSDGPTRYHISELGLHKKEPATDSELVCSFPGAEDLWNDPDSDYLWVRYKGHMARVRKEDNDILFKTVSEIPDPKKVAQELVNSIHDAGTPDEKIRRIAAFYETYGDKWEDIIFTLAQNIESGADPGFLQAVDRLLNDKLSDLEKEVVLWKAIPSCINTRKADLAFQYFMKLKTEYPDSRFLKRPEMKRIGQTLETYNKICESPEPEDKKLWLMAECFRDCAFQSHLYFESEKILSKFYFKMLLAKYPESDYADEAEWFILSRNMFRSEEGIYEEDHRRKFEQETGQYQRFIRTYPQSDLLPLVKKRLAYIYMSYAGGPYLEYNYYNHTDETRKGLLKDALQIYLDILRQYPGSRTANEIIEQNYVKDLVKTLHPIPITLAMTAELKEHKYGAPVRLTLTLTNRSERDVTIRIYPDLPNFSLDINWFQPGRSSLPKLPLKRDPTVSLSKMKKTEIILKANGGTYSETIIPGESAMCRGVYGSYDFSRSVTYTAGGHFPEFQWQGYKWDIYARDVEFRVNKAENPIRID